MLVYHGVDETAQQELVLLAQLSKAGAKKANHIIAKLLKKDRRP